jgi:hypothetical protein
MPEHSSKLASDVPRLDSALLKPILIAVRQKKELSGLSQTFISFHAFHFLRTHPSYSIAKKSQLDELVTYVRKQARTIYGVFQIPSQLSQRNQLLSHCLLKQSSALQTILASHVSTQERMPFYSEFIQAILAQISHIQPNISRASFLDLGCGLHPVAFFSHVPTCASYIAVEQSEVDIAYLQQFFETNKLPARGVACDLVLESKHISSIIPQAVDVCFMFKLLDTLESQERFITYTLFQQIHAKLFVVSFSIRTISAHATDRGATVGWFCKALDRLGYQFHTQVFPSEVVYFCTKADVTLTATPFNTSVVDTLAVCVTSEPDSFTVRKRRVKSDVGSSTQRKKGR